MSQKRARQERRLPKEQPTNNVLAIQKQNVKHYALDYLVSAIFCLFLSVALIIVLTLEGKTDSWGILYGGLPILSAVIASFAFVSTKRFLLFRALNRIPFETEEITDIACEKVRFISHPESRHTTSLVGIIFIDSNKQKYIYVLPHVLSDSKNTRNAIRLKCVGKTVETICYKGTNIVKYFALSD